MLYNYCNLFIYFFIFSIIGYIVEVINVSIIDKKLVLNRGFLIGPYLPIYGLGSVFMTTFLPKYENDVIALFIMSMIICSILEYTTSLILEKIFNVRWWDYSEKKYNIDGRICLENGFLFGLAGIVIIKILNPIVFNIGYKIPSIIIIVIGIILSLFFYGDVIWSLYIMSKLKINSYRFTKKDATSEIKVQVRNELYKYNALTTRLLKSFPHLKPYKKEFITFNKLIFKTREEIKKLKQENNLKKLKKQIKEEKRKLKEYKKKKKD